jgi:hypothetical protein
MGIIESLTPKDTEEVKPGLFIKKTNKGYRQINPAAWNGKIRWKEQLKTIITFRSILSLGIILFLVFGYVNDNKSLMNFYDKITNDPVGFCREIDRLKSENRCSEFLQEQGLCDFNTNYSKLKFNLTITP